MDEDDFDPDERDAREAGREALDQEGSLGSVIVHLYRAEVDREITWRERLDSTTNWAVTVIAGILAYAFSSEEVAHSIVLVGVGTGIVFLVIEARRFQRYDVWRSRVRSMQQNFFANALDPTAGVEQREWRPQLGDDYRRPEIRIPLRRALSHRLRRVYLPLLIGLALVWLVGLVGTDEPLLEAASVSGTPGWVVFAVVGVGYCCLFVLAFWPSGEAVSELDEAVDRGDLERDE